MRVATTYIVYQLLLKYVPTAIAIAMAHVHPFPTGVGGPALTRAQRGHVFPPKHVDADAIVRANENFYKTTIAHSQYQKVAAQALVVTAGGIRQVYEAVMNTAQTNDPSPAVPSPALVSNPVELAVLAVHAGTSDAESDPMNPNTPPEPSLENPLHPNFHENDGTPGLYNVGPLLSTLGGKYAQGQAGNPAAGYATATNTFSRRDIEAANMYAKLSRLEQAQLDATRMVARAYASGLNEDEATRKIRQAVQPQFTAAQRAAQAAARAERAERGRPAAPPPPPPPPAPSGGAGGASGGGGGGGEPPDDERMPEGEDGEENASESASIPEEELGDEVPQHEGAVPNVPLVTPQNEAFPMKLMEVLLLALRMSALDLAGLCSASDWKALINAVKQGGPSAQAAITTFAKKLTYNAIRHCAAITVMREETDVAMRTAQASSTWRARQQSGNLIAGFRPALPYPEGDPRLNSVNRSMYDKSAFEQSVDVAGGYGAEVSNHGVLSTRRTTAVAL